MNSQFLLGVIALSVSAAAWGDAYTCKAQNGTRVIQTEPCGAGEKTVAAVRAVDQREQEKRAQSAQQELDRQREWLDRRLQAQAVERQQEEKRAAEERAAEAEKAAAAQRAAAEARRGETVVVLPYTHRQPIERRPAVIVSPATGTAMSRPGNGYGHPRPGANTQEAASGSANTRTGRFGSTAQ